jgi:hypothetical protein
MFPLGTRERVPAGGMPPRGLGDRRDGALLARTEECARAGSWEPIVDRRRGHHRRLRATAPRFYHKNDVSLPVVPKPRRLCACSIPSNAMCSSPDPPAP